MDNDDGEVREINADKLPPEMQFNFMLMLLAQALPKAGMGDEFILISRHPEKGWGCHSNIQDVERIQETMRRLSDKAPVQTELHLLDMEDFRTDDGVKRRVKQ